MAEQRQLEGRVALITGGGRGIGRAIALAYAAEGARLALAARTESELKDTAETIIAQYGTDVHTVIADVTNRQQVDNAVASTLERFGAIDVLVNNAGNLGPVGRLWENDPDEWEQTIAIHVLGTYYGCRAVIPHMLERGDGRIVNMSGVGGPNVTAYEVAKMGITNLTENLALELADTPITVNAISPGSIHTRMWEENRDRALGGWRHGHVRAGSAGYVGSGSIYRTGGPVGGLPRKRRLREAFGAADSGLRRPL